MKAMIRKVQDHGGGLLYSVLDRLDPTIVPVFALSARRTARVLAELESLNVRIDDLCGLLYSVLDQLDPTIVPVFAQFCRGCGVPLPTNAPLDRCGYCNL